MHVAKALLEDGHEIYFQGMAYHGIPAQLSTLEGVTMLPNGAHKFGQDMLPFWIKQIKPNIVLTLMDIWMDGWLLEKNMQGISWLKMIPLDSPSMLPSWRQAINAYDVPITFSQFGTQLCERTCGRKTAYIPHCVDTNVFKPMTETKKKQARIRNNLEGCFVVGMVGRNQIRKMQPQVFEAFAEFAKDKDDVRLLLHMDLKEAEQPPAQFGWDLNQIAMDLGMRDKIVMTSPNAGYQFKYTFGDDQMNTIYNMMDVHYLCGNEGFGVPAIEAMACGTPNIIPDFTTGAELTAHGKTGWLIPPAKTKWYNAAGAKWCFPHREGLIKALEEAYGKKKMLEEKSIRAREYAEKVYSPQVLYPQWRELIQKVLIKPLPLVYSKKQLGV